MKKTRSRKFFSNVGGTLAFVGGFLMLGICFGADHNLCTSAEFWQIFGASFGMLVVGVTMYNFNDDEGEQ